MCKSTGKISVCRRARGFEGAQGGENHGGKSKKISRQGAKDARNAKGSERLPSQSHSFSSLRETPCTSKLSIDSKTPW